MRLDITFRFDRLICLARNEGADEPYLWTFFLKLDGDTVRPSAADADKFEGRVRVTAPPGSHGNLGVEDVEREQRIAIPPERGVYTTELRPIGIPLPGETYWVPGRVIAVAILMEEDDSSGRAIEQGHQALGAVIEQRINAFIDNIDMSEVRHAANVRLAEHPGSSFKENVAAIIQERLEALVADAQGGAADIVSDHVLRHIITRDLSLAIYTGLPFLVAFDQDELIGSNSQRADERGLLNDELGLDRPFVAELKAPRPEDYEGAYLLMGAVEACPHFAPADFRQLGTTLAITMAENNRFSFDGGALCIPEGVEFVWKRWEQLEMEDFLFLYPFVPVTWSIEGQPLLAPGGEIKLQRESSFPFFDPHKLHAPAVRKENREVVVHYERYEAGQLHGVRLRNRAEDGNYQFRFHADLRVGGANRRVLDRELQFQGQALTSPFYRGYNECIAEKFKRKVGRTVGPRDLWGPTERLRWFEEQTRLGAELVDSRLVKATTVERVLVVLRDRLRLG